MARMAWLALALALLLALPATAEDAPLIIDVVEGRFRCGAYDIALLPIDTPIALGFREGHALVEVLSVDGLVEIDLGETQVALTQNAAPFVATLAMEAEEDAGEPCPYCGRSTAIGYHAMMDCGHIGCLKPADHFQVCVSCRGYVCNGRKHDVCETCGKRWCVHVDLECAYTRNPTPTPYATKTPEGETQGYAYDPGGAFIKGTPPNEQVVTWDPGSVFVKRNAPPEGQGSAFVPGGE